MKGNIKWFDVKKGYGFVTAEDGTEHFVHHKRIKKGRTYKGFEAGDQVEFDVETKEDGKSLATSVVRVMEDRED